MEFSCKFNRADQLSVYGIGNARISSLLFPLNYCPELPGEQREFSNSTRVRALDQKRERERESVWQRKIRVFVTSARFAWLVNCCVCYVCRSSIRSIEHVSTSFGMCFEVICDIDLNVGGKRKKRGKNREREREKFDNVVSYLRYRFECGRRELKNAEISDTREDYETRLYYTFMKRQIQNSARCCSFIRFRDGHVRFIILEISMLLKYRLVLIIISPIKILPAIILVKYSFLVIKCHSN